MMKRDLAVHVPSPAIIRILAGIIVFLVIASTAAACIRACTGRTSAYGFVPKFDVNRENNIPTYFSSFLLLTAAGLLAIVTMSKRRDRAQYATHWFILMIIFLFLSVDESASLHELLIKPLRHALNLPGIWFHAWVIAGFAFVVIFVIFYYRFFLNLPARTKLYLVIATLFLVGGAIGVEFIGGAYLDIHGDWTFTYGIMTIIEEAFEMIGILFFIIAILDYIKLDKMDVVFSFK